jgi:hypothetical protein
MIDQATANTMLQVAATIDTVAAHFKAAMYQMQKNYSDGVACFLKNEAMELWRNAGKIRDYVILHEADIVNIPARAAAPTGSAEMSQCLEELKKRHNQVCSVTHNAGKQLKSAGHDAPANFMFSLYESMQKDYQEVAKYANLTMPGISSNQKITDAELYRIYSGKLYTDG